MGFEVTGDAYQRFMGGFSEPLAPLFADLAGVAAGSGSTVLDVGCGPGALTAELLARLGPGHVTAVDPSEAFVEAVRARLPGTAVLRAGAERLPLPAGSVDAALAQLVVHFMSDPAAGTAEMARVTRPGGTVAVCVWDHGGGRGPLSAFWAGVLDVDPDARTESALPGSHRGDLSRLLSSGGLSDVEETELTVRRPYATVEQWWEPYTLGVGPAGDHVARLDRRGRDRLRDACAARLPEPPFTVEAVAWAARGTVGSARA